ncbi:TPA: Mu transposase C-terminal domain-containing protein [Providencia alcalifaciens]|nr:MULTISPECIES: Mu transposase C-terminal domain-containing protein [Providencia]ETS98839.1 Mu transposase, C-terminal domain protein [Providencia alcalifaciens PAL-3]ETT05646.1 Mu transposase, C-terminal domain protein [Providencia alcalifaciens F90-2004]EUC99273.1 Mu transposase, C-terminal domain protein [Providencia alcalifaciens PAL-1]MTC21295.1 DDE-type integrase/transposase/recombinase [Providencia sp. wls1938]MTC22170.1 DDE-type integrase/transposase/recombinase [Providencia sp. wls19
MSIWLTAKECVGLPDFPTRLQNIRSRLDKYSGKNENFRRRRVGTKAFEYHIDCLPEAAQEVVKQRHFNAVLEQKKTDNALEKTVSNTSVKPVDELALMRQCPALLEREVSSLTADQKGIADARATLALEVLSLIYAGDTRIGAVTRISEQSRKGVLPMTLQQAADNANARKGTTRRGVSIRSLQEWVTLYQSTNNGDERLALLAPGHHKETRPEQVSWLPMFLSHHRNVNGPSLMAAYRTFTEEWQELYADQPTMLDVMPSYYAVRRIMDKLPKRERARGRVTGSAARALETYQKRDWSQMPVNGCWISDGKSMNLKVAHPIHGRPFTPELTLVLDGRTRFLVGWSLDLSENVIAVASAYRYGMKLHGKPLFTYSDNGGGEKNKTLDADITGIFPRLGIKHMTGIPGNPQARGIIERLNAVIPRRVAQQFQTYNGLGADREHVRITSRRIESAVKAIENNKELNPVQKGALAKLPSWQQLLDAIEVEVQRYNYEHEHSELPKRNGRHLTPAAYRQEVLAAEGDEIEYLTEIELREMFMPEVVRKAQRGWVEFNNNEYFAEDLILVDGEDVRVAYDIHDAKEVIIRKLDGTYVCTAIWNGNKVAAVPTTHMAKAIDDRRKRRLARVEDKRREIEAEACPLIDAKPTPDFGSFIPADEPIKTPRKPMTFLQSEYDYLSAKAGNQ